MKVKRVAIFLATGMMALLVLVTAVPPIAQAQGPNLLTNPGFEEGHYNQDNITEITVPNGWRMHWSNNESQIFNGYAETARPETVVWNIAGAPDNERDVFWRDGIYTVKIFKGWAPVWAAMSQDVGGLEVGRRYRLVAPVFIDIVADYQGGQKVAPDDPRQGRVRLGASPVGTGWRDEANINYSGWWTAESINPFYLAYPTFVHEFTATAPEMTVWIEVASNYPHPNNGFFIDTVGLYALDEFDIGGVPVAVPPSSGETGGGGGGGGQPAPSGPAAPAPQPEATPRADGSVVHIIQSGDSFWSLAIQYAAVMGITPEEALTAIPELNNNPTVINTGQELLIVPPNPEGAAPTEEPTPEDETAEPTAEPSEADTRGGGATIDPNSETSSVGQVIQNAKSGSICVGAYLDEDADGVRDSGEMPVAENAITLAKDGNTVSTYITNGVDDIYCFEDLQSGTYQVQIYPSADYQATSDASWAVAIAEGVMIPLNFSLQYTPDGAAVADASAPTDGSETASDAPQEGANAPTESGSSNPLADNLGFIVIGVAAVLVVLAIAGVVLLRRG